MPLPLPNLPAGCVQITCQANIDGFAPTYRVLSPRIVAKLQSLCADLIDYTQTPPVPVFVDMTAALEGTLDRYLLTMVENRYPDPPDQSIAELEAALAAAKAAAQPKFL